MGNLNVEEGQLEEFELVRDIWFNLSDDEKYKFISDNAMIQTSKGKMIQLDMPPFQKKWLLDGPLFSDFTKKTLFDNRICLKCRGVGASYVMIAVEATLAAWLYPNIFIPFVSATEDQAKDLIKHCKRVIKNAKFTIPLDVPLENQTQTTITFANGSTIRSFAGGNPDGIRGPRALISYLDEFAFVGQPQEVMSAVEYFHGEGGQMNILSTPYGKQNLYWQIWADRDNYKAWKRHLVSLFTDMSTFDIDKSLIEQQKERDLKLSAPWLNIDFLEKKRLQDKPFNYANFLQEMVGLPMDEVSSAIPESILDTFSMESYEVEHRPLLVDGKPDPAPIFIMSADYGADVNMTAVVLYEAKDERFIVCHTERFRGPFPEQVMKMTNLFKRFSPKYFIGDATGMGGKAWTELLADQITDCAMIGINYSKKDYAEIAGVNMANKEYMVNVAIKLMSEGVIVTPKNHRRLREELLGLQKLVYEKTTRYSGKDGPAKGDDLAFAAIQGTLIYDKIFTLGEGETVGVAGGLLSQIKARKEQSRQPIIRKAEFIEATGSAKNVPSRSTPFGFSHLI